MEVADSAQLQNNDNDLAFEMWAFRAISLCQLWRRKLSSESTSEMGNPGRVIGLCDEENRTLFVVAVDKCHVTSYLVTLHALKMRYQNIH